MSLKKNIISNYFGNIFSVLINFSLVPIYLKYLSVEEYGLITFFATLTSVFVILDMGLGLTVNKEVATSLARNDSKEKTGDTIRTFELIYWLVAVFIGCLLFFFSDIIAGNWLIVDEISVETLSVVVSLMGVALLFRWPISFYNNSLSGFQKMVNLNIIKIFVLSLNLILIFILFDFFDLKIKGVFKFLISLYFLNTLILICNVWNIKGLSFFKATFKKNILYKAKSYILSIGLFSIIATLYTLLDKVFVSKFFTVEDLGYYSLVSMMALALLQLVYPVSSALFPKFVENYTKSEHENSFKIFRKGYQIIITLVFSVSSVLIFFRSEILFLWTQKENVTEKSVVYFLPLIFGTIFYTLHILIISIYTAIGKTKPVNNLYILISIFYISLISIAVWNHNLLWVAYSWGIANLLLFLGALFLGYKILGFERVKIFILKDFLMPMLILILVFITSNIYSLPRFNTFTSILIITFGSLLSFLVFLLMTPYRSFLFKNK